MRRVAAGAVICALAVTAAPASAKAPDAGPADTGPALTVPAAALQESLQCTGLERGRPAVLLIHGTALTPASLEWNYVRAFAAAARPYCTVALPERGMADIQVSAEHVVAAIRTMAAQTERKVSIVGHSQGGMIGRWALKFWPDTRGKVADLVGLAPSNSGTLDANVICTPTCAPAIWQQRAGSDFLRALNDGAETYAGIDYTVIYTTTDGVIVPAESSRLTTGQGRIANVTVGEICPVHYADHLTLGSFDAVAYALALDALDSPGPADPARIDPAVCLQPFHEGVDPATLATDHARTVTTIAETIATTPHVPAEPELRDYAR